MQRLEVSGAVRLIYKLLGVKGLIYSGSSSRRRPVAVAILHVYKT